MVLVCASFLKKRLSGSNPHSLRGVVIYHSYLENSSVVTDIMRKGLKQY
jgi:hypothetical protein